MVSVVKQLLNQDWAHSMSLIDFWFYERLTCLFGEQVFSFILAINLRAVLGHFLYHPRFGCSEKHCKVHWL